MDWRRGVTGHDTNGKPAVLLDQSIAIARGADGAGSGPILTLNAWPASAEAGEPGPESEAPTAGGIRVVALELEASSGWIDRPERGQPGTLNAYVVVAGDLVVGLDDGEMTLRVGEVLVVGGQPHRLRPYGDVGVRLVATAITPDPAATERETTSLQGASGTAKRIRRVVAGTDVAGKTFVAHDGDPAVSFFIGDEGPPNRRFGRRVGERSPCRLRRPRRRRATTLAARTSRPRTEGAQP